MVAGFIFGSVLMDKNIEHQTFDAVSTIIQKKFAKHDFLSGKNSNRNNYPNT